MNDFSENQTNPVPTDAPQELSIDEYCARKSGSDKRVELIAGFHHDEKSQGHVKDTESAFDSRFAAFINKPA